ncbi:hypothetical protein [Paraburkholderia sediminicola]|uniref:hypothetical protein n=1 Tax=Paraburkholderia sediminicola TaxID=458836 RepID=UPI0038BD5375
MTETDGGFRDPLVKAVAKYLAEADKQLEARKRPGWHLSAAPHPFFVRRSLSGCIDPEYDHLRIIVTQPLRRRALYVADAFVCAVKDRGFKVSLKDRAVVIEAKDVSMRFRLTELEKKQGTDWDSPSIALGRLRLSLRRHSYATGIPDGISIRDEPGRTIEDQLNGLMVKLRILVLGAEARAEQRRIEDIKREEQLRVWEEERRARAQEVERAKEEAAKKETFLTEADLWDRVDRRRNYLDHLERTARERGMDLAEGTPLREWIDWARAVCDSDDSLDARLRNFVQP